MIIEWRQRRNRQASADRGIFWWSRVVQGTAIVTHTGTAANTVSAFVSAASGTVKVTGTGTDTIGAWISNGQGPRLNVQTGPGDDDTPKRKKQRYGKVGNKYVPFADWQELALLRAENRKRVDAAEAAKVERSPLTAAQDAGLVAPLTPQGLPRDATAFAVLIPPATGETLSGAPEIGPSVDPAGMEAQALAIREAAQAELRKRRRREEDAVALLMVH